MKKLFTIISAMIIAATMQSCEGPAGPEGPMGPAGPAGSSFYYINKEYTVDSNDWLLMGNDYIYEFPVPELTKNVCESAVINVYTYTNGFQNQLPHVTFHRVFKDNKNPQTNEITSVAYDWTQTVRYDFKEGMLTFIVNYSDFADDEQPETMDFRLVVHY